ncbi:MAG: hypothetical protein RW306_15880 [Geobacteraceae bacterium]|nr:hypothetical protein [Geobacteraceae bacterium]
MKYNVFVKIIFAIFIIIAFTFAFLLIQPLVPIFKEKITTAPSPYFVYCTMLVTALNFLWAPFLYYLGKNDKLNEKLITFREEILSKKIIIPICVEPLTKFIETETSNIRSLHVLKEEKDVIDHKFKEYIENFKKEKSIIINKFMILGSIDKSIYKYISEEVDNLEDVVIDYCALNILGNQESQREKKYDLTIKSFYETYSKILSHFISQYDRVVVRK